MSVFSALPLIIEPADLAERLHAPELILVDLSAAARYQQGHIPGAHHVESSRTQFGQPPAPGLLPTRENLQSLLGELGHDEHKVYVTYDDEGGPWAGRFIWLLDSIGHTRYHFLNGGLRAWENEGRALTQESPAVVAPTQPELTIQPSPTATADYLESRLKADDLALWDARSAEEYRGEKALAARGGHIPGAINLNWTDALDDSNGLRIRRDIGKTLNDLGITADREIITHCQTHRRSGLTYVILKALGYPRVKAYAGSWSEWGNDPKRPFDC